MSIQSFNIINSDTTLTSQFEYNHIDASSGSVTITLPSIDTDGLSLSLKRIDQVSTNIVTIIPSGSDTIDGVASTILNVNGNIQIMSIVSDSNWTTTLGSHSDIYGPITEIQIKFHSQFLPIVPYLLINTTAYVANQYFVYRGSNFYGKLPPSMKIAFSLDSGTADTSFNIKIIDVTNKNQIAILTSTATTNSNTFLTDSTTTFTNIPTTDSVFEINTQLSVAGPPYIRLHAVYFQAA